MSKKSFAEGHQPGIGKGNFANMPQDVKMVEYPKNGAPMDLLDDTITGIDQVISRSEHNRMKYKSDQK